MLRFLAKLFGKKGNGQPQKKAAECEPEAEAVTRKNVNSRSQKIRIDLESVIGGLEEALDATEAGPAD